MTSRGRSDGGFVTAWTVGLAVACMALVGLVADGGRALGDRSDAFGAAAAAARAGVQQIDEGQAVQGVLTLDEARAVSAAEAFLVTRGYVGTVSVDGIDVTVTVEGETDLLILPTPDVVSYSVTASARAVQGDGPV